MNSKVSIWIIAGPMTLALLGIIALQVYWIDWSFRLTETQFDRAVRQALNSVSERVENDEFMSIQQNTMPSAFGVNGFSERYASLGTRDIYDMITYRPGECNCDDCRSKRFNHYVEERQRQEVRIFFSTAPLAERIHLEHLDAFIKDEMENHGISLAYNYGVYAKTKKAFVIRDGHFMFDQGRQQALPNVADRLLSSGYRVQLFKNTSPPPGYLIIHFPQRSSYLWRSVLLPLIGSFVFTSIILFSFTYAIRIILTQKKLSIIKNDFINNMTHEFKTPIATISLAADSITSPMIAGQSDKVARFANIIKQENRRMNSQVEKVLQMALIDKREFQLKLGSVDVHDVIRQAVNNINLQVEKKGGEALTELRAANSSIEADLTHISNVINNLLDNANKYTPETPRIVVSTRNVGNGIEIAVKDNGIGMSKEDRKRIFDKFYRVHTGNLHDIKGFGLGLSYVKAIVTAHKGQVDVKSELGKGSTFTVFFPFQHAPA